MSSKTKQLIQQASMGIDEILPLEVPTNARIALEALLGHFLYPFHVARFLGVNSTHLSKYIHEEKVSPTLHKALVAKGWLKYKTRHRVAIDVSSDELKQYQLYLSPVELKALMIDAIQQKRARWLHI